MSLGNLTQPRARQDGRVVRLARIFMQGGGDDALSRVRPYKEPISSVRHARLSKPQMTSTLHHAILRLDIVSVVELDDRDSKLSSTQPLPITCSIAFARRSKSPILL